MGVEVRECGEHRTTGGRAWCYVDSEWCYPEELCRGCEIPRLRTEVESLKFLGDQMAEAVTERAFDFQESAWCMICDPSNHTHNPGCPVPLAEEWKRLREGNPDAP